MELRNFDTNTLKYPEIVRFPPACEYEYCKKILSDLEAIPGEENEHSIWEARRVGLLCGMLESIIELGYSRGSQEMKERVIDNIF